MASRLTRIVLALALGAGTWLHAADIQEGADSAQDWNANALGDHVTAPGVKSSITFPATPAPDTTFTKANDTASLSKGSAGRLPAERDALIRSGGGLGTLKLNRAEAAPSAGGEKSGDLTLGLPSDVDAEPGESPGPASVPDSGVALGQAGEKVAPTTGKTGSAAFGDSGLGLLKQADSGTSGAHASAAGADISIQPGG